MAYKELQVSQDIEEAIETIITTSKGSPVLVFKKSMRCSISLAAEHELQRYLASLPESSSLNVLFVDVLEERPLALGISDHLGLRHESPQAFVFTSGKLQWNDSHGKLTSEAFKKEVEKAEACCGSDAS